MDCWASCLGGCSDKVSREHVVSQSLFRDDEVMVQGFSWCPQLKKIGISSLTAKILCRHHNSMLSPVDQGGADAFDALREMRRISSIREKVGGRFNNVVRHTIDGPLLERWLLKTLINISYNGDKPIGRSSTIAGKPSDELVRIAFGQAQFSGKAGLYIIGMVGMNMHSKDMFKFAPLVKDGHHIEGGVFVFRGHPLLLFLEPEGVPKPLTGLHIEGYDLGKCAVNFHLQRIKVLSQRKHLSQMLTFTWPVA